MAWRPDTPLFCPFCRECFEHRSQCPEHELELVPFGALPPEQPTGPPDGEPVAPHDLRWGRGLVAVAATCLLVGVFLPFVTVTGAERERFTGLQVALEVAPNLWMVPAVAFALFSILVRRRTPKAMRGARLVVPALGLIALASAGYTFASIHAGAGQDAVRVAPSWGAFVMAAGGVASLLGGARLGIPPRQRPVRVAGATTPAETAGRPRRS